MARVNWLSLRSVIEHVETLGPGYTVFQISGHPAYGVCPTGEVTNGEWLGFEVIPGTVFVQHRHARIIYQTKVRRDVKIP